MSILGQAERACYDLKKRVDPSAGLLETLLVLEGRPVSLDAHLDRLRRSAGAVFGRPLPKTLMPSMQLAASGLRLGRLRATVSWTPLGKPRCHVEATEVDPGEIFPPPSGGRSLHPVEVRGHLGPHKWADRAWMEDLKPPLGDSVPLLVCSRTLEVLETIRGNIFLLEKGMLVTPALDGRILPGIARAQTIEIARDMGIEVSERPVTLKELLEADEVFTTASVRGIEAIDTIAEAEFEDGPEVHRLAVDLRRAWLRKERILL